MVSVIIFYVFLIVFYNVFRSYGREPNNIEWKNVEYKNSNCGSDPTNLFVDTFEISRY